MSIRMSTEERRVQITQAAIKIIGEEGLRAFTVAKVAKEVGIKDGSIFRHFKNKGEIVSSVLDNLETVMANSIPSANDNPLERLGEFFVKRIELLTGQPGIKSIVFSDQLIHAGNETDLKRVLALRKKARKYIKSTLLEASQKHLIRPELDLDDVFVVFHGMVMGFLFIIGENTFEGSITDRSKKIWMTFQSMIQISGRS